MFGYYQSGTNATVSASVATMQHVYDLLKTGYYDTDKISLTGMWE
ncbi:MAG: hypothetical protein WCJ81_01790 [bacterium]